MPTFLAILVLVILFLILSLSADQVTKNLRALALKLGVPIFMLGILLGVLTSLPEGAIAINAMFNKVQGLSIGNLLGGIVVMMSLILGLGVILNQEIKNDGRLGFLMLCFAYFLLPLVLALKGSLNYWDGLAIIIMYFVLMSRLYASNHAPLGIKVSMMSEKKITRELFIVLGGIVLILLTSNFITDITADLLNKYDLSPFVIGLIFFPIGTNLPEITVAIASWRRKDKELSFSNLLGSSASNVLILGILVTIRTFPITQTYNYYVTFIFLIILSALLLIFYRSGKRLTLLEGVALILVYIIFIFFQFQSDPLHL